MSGEALTLPEIAKRAGADYRTLKNWEFRGLITPSIRNASGGGNASFYSEHDAEIVVSLVNLRRRGLDMTALGVVATAWRAGDGFPECPICHRSELKLPVLDRPAELKEGER